MSHLGCRNARVQMITTEYVFIVGSGDQIQVFRLVQKTNPPPTKLSLRPGKEVLKDTSELIYFMFLL